MSHTFHTELHRIWQNAVDLYTRGDSTPDTIVQEQDLSLLSGWGLNRMDVFDFAEDWCLHREPDFSTFLLVHYARWRFFVEKQKSIPSSNLLDPKTLPPKDQKARGILWLPEFYPKPERNFVENSLQKSCMVVEEIGSFLDAITSIPQNSSVWYVSMAMMMMR
jgi:hypothetical protein